ncbi:YDG domain-containing protein [Inhella proteolytica]|uniref:Filamentous hemagglutinin N-terminal domain-containing protein n=1 Tax=Inhella proteolytica TaxID=2795029 RepID=A0A931J6I0_9BURK|nr:YDG domain-containing protein [Inhella proteolytica]MBH9577752.1 filamentous hemagglutinin N-terminal domain-containing protein [Inhella proteolytica]
MKTSNTSKSRAFLLRPLVQALAASALLSLPLAAVSQVLPSGLQVVRGQAQVSTQGQQMTVTNSPNAILNWNQFGIGTGYGVHFQQANAASKVLNRVVGQDPSQILGSLTSNGQVWLLNPNGILFGAQARVDVASLVASTLNLSDQDWLSGRLRFEQDASLPGGHIVNQGELHGAQGGQVVLLAADVRNEGQISAPQGQAVLAAGRQIELVDTAAPHVRVRLLAEAGEVLNSGVLQAEDGRIDVHAAAVRQQGQVHADGARGGEVLLQAVSGRLTQLGEVSARGTQGAGGQIQLLGREVVVDGQALVDASGAAGGGEILVGGGLQGKDVRVPNARAVFFGSEATARADALQQGQGGTVVLWSDEATRAYGHFSARGGVQGGAGGLVETSGGWLDARPASMRVDAARGAAGTWLIDPYNVSIGVGSDTNVSVTGTAPVLVAPTASGSFVAISTLESALAGGQNVTVTTSGAGSEAGNISWSGNLSLLSVVGTLTLTLIADGDVSFSGSTISALGTNLSLDVQAGRSGTGSVLASGLNISTSGNVTLGGYSGAPAPGSASQPGIHLNGVDFNLGGDLSLRATNTAGMSGVEITSSDLTQRRLTIDGKASTGKGILVEGGTSILSEESAVLRGEGSTHGVHIRNGSQVQVNHDGYLASGTLDVQGTGRGSGAIGVLIDASSGGTVLISNQVGSLRVSGSTDSSSAPAVQITGAAASTPYQALDASMTGLLSIEALQGAIQISGSQINQDDLAPNPRDFSIKGPSLNLSNSWLIGGGLMRLQADSQVFQSSSLITAYSSAVPAVLIGQDGTVGASRIDNQSGSGLFGGNISQWTLVGQHPLDSATFTPGQNQFNPGALNPNYKAYGTTGYDTTFIAGKGNGFHFSSPVYAAITGTALDKVYDGTTAASVSGLGASGLAGDTLTLKPGVTAVFRDKHVGTDKPLDLTSSDAFTAVDGSGRPIYGYSVGASGLTASITPLAVLVSGLSAQDKVYDGTTVAGLVGSASFTVLPGDSVSLTNPTGEFSDRHVGTAKPVSLSGLSFGGPDGGNYVLNFSGSLSANITPAPLAVGGLIVEPKVYDGNTTATLGGTAVPTALGGDSVTLSGTPLASYDTKQVGTGKPVKVSGLSLSGPDAGNYSFAGSLMLSGDITPATLVLSGLTALNKVYDGTTLAQLSGTAVAAPLAGDSVVVSGSPSASFDTRHVGTNKPVVLTGLNLSGADAGNYVLKPESALTASITPAPLNIAGLVAGSKVYDGTVTAQLTGTPTFQALAGDDVGVAPSLTASFVDKHVGIGKTVTLQGLALTGADAGNYMPVAAGVLKADITPRPATVSGLQAQSKVYDGSDLATLGGTPVLSILAGDQVSLASALDARFNNKQVGTAKPVTVSGLSFGGADAANYSFTLSGSLSADITPRVLNLAGVQVGSKVYDGSASAPLSGTPSISPVAGDQVALAGTLQAQFGGSNAAGVGQAKPVQLSGLTLGGADAGNYTLALPALTGVVTPATLTYVATPAQRLVGQLVGQLSGSVTGFVAGESLATATTGSLQFTAPAVGGANTPALVEGSFAIVGSGLSAANYSFAQAAGNASALVVYALTPEILAQTPAVTPVGGGGSGGAGGSDPGTPPGVPPLGGTGPAGGPPPPLGVLDLSSPLPPAGGGGGAGAPAGGAAGAGSGGSVGGTSGGTSGGSPSGTSGGSSGGSGGNSGSGGGAGMGGGLAAGAGIAAAGARFGAVDLGGMSMDAIQQLLDERNRIKRKLFEEALTRLESNPGLADLQTCTNRKEAEAGNCLVTEALRLELQAEASGAPSAIKPPASPAPGAAPAPAPSTAAPAVAQAVAAPPPPAFSQRRAVKTAALPQIERKIALVIGVNDYQDRNIPQLEGAVGDAEAMASLVESRLGYETVLLRNATKTQVVAALNRLALELRPQDSVLVYYAGHGDEINAPEGGKQGYWQLADSDARRPETWLSNNDIGRLMRAMSARQVALLSDSCYSGSLVTGQRLRAVPAPGALNPNEVLGERTVVVMSSGGNAPVADSGENGHSPFAFHLFQTLGEVPSWKPGANVFETVRFMVARKFPQSPQYGFSGPVNVPKPVDYLFEQRKLDQR